MTTYYQNICTCESFSDYLYKYSTEYMLILAKYEWHGIRWRLEKMGKITSIGTLLHGRTDDSFLLRQYFIINSCRAVNI